MAKQSEAIEAELRPRGATWAEQILEDAKALTDAIHELKEVGRKEVRGPVGERPKSPPEPTAGETKPRPPE